MRAAVVVTTYNRAQYLPELVKCLDAQTLPRNEFEVVIVDNGSTDGTATSGLATLRLEINHGPGGGRNAGVAATRAPIIAITDDDCLPSPAWLERLVTCFDDPDVVVAQGHVEPDPATKSAMGPFDHSITVRGPTPFFETCNVAYRRAAFDLVGGFDEHDPLLHPPTGRAFGEDALLGAAVLDRGGTRAFAHDALVYHRCVPRTFAQHLADRRQLRLFPALARRLPLLRGLFVGGVFLNRTTIKVDLGITGALLAVLTRQPLALVATIPWLAHRLNTTRWYAGGPRLFAQYAVSDAVTLASLLEGTARHRRLVL
ncbi:MAG TPA: glycosyltransferase family 2 protein [Acidimicrobiales bacterium]|nr:glycosyltransferase family 2 protein [Acidimicrobiales bacterium]